MIVGIVILLIGLICIIQILNPELAINFHLIWPILLIGLASYKIIQNKSCSLWSTLGLYIGIWWFLVEIDIISYQYYDLFWPIILVILGTYLILDALGSKKDLPIPKNQAENKSLKNYNGIFGNVEEKIHDDDFKGTLIYAIFGGVSLDLKDIKIHDDVVINVYSICGGTTIFVPEEYNIIMHSTAIFGGNENKHDEVYNHKKKTIHVNCISIFGGCEIK